MKAVFCFIPWGEFCSECFQKATPCYVYRCHMDHWAGFPLQWIQDLCIIDHEMEFLGWGPEKGLE